MDIKKRIISELAKRNVPRRVAGYRYLVDATFLAHEDMSLLYDRVVTKALYPEIAKLHHSTSSRVERAIRYAIDKSGSTLANSGFISDVVWTLKEEDYEK